MKNFYYNLCGGLNTQLTPIIMGADSRKMYWADGFNVEPYKNQGIARQKGNKTLLKIAEKIGPRPAGDGAETMAGAAFAETDAQAPTGGDLSAFLPESDTLF